MPQEAKMPDDMPSVFTDSPNIVLNRDENKKRWKVAVYSLACDINTVYADTPDEAIQKVGEGFGQHAGVEGPTVVGTACVQFESPAAKDFINQWIVNMQRMQEKLLQEHRKIIVPSMVTPKG